LNKITTKSDDGQRFMLTGKTIFLAYFWCNSKKVNWGDMALQR